MKTVYCSSSRECKDLRGRLLSSGTNLEDSARQVVAFLERLEPERREKKTEKQQRTTCNKRAPSLRRHALLLLDVILLKYAGLASHL